MGYLGSIVPAAVSEEALTEPIFLKRGTRLTEMPVRSLEFWALICFYERLAAGMATYAGMTGPMGAAGAVIRAT